MSEKESIHETMKIIIIGQFGIGKTSLNLKFTKDGFHPDRQIFGGGGSGFQTKVVEVNGKKKKLQIWDTVERERWSDDYWWEDIWRGSNGVLLCYACNNRDSLEWMKLFWDQRGRDMFEDAYKILVATKVDEDDRCISYSEGKALAAQYKMPYYEVSAKTGQNVNEVFYEVAERYIRQVIKEDKKVIFMGDFGAGKTSIFNQFVNKEFFNPNRDKIQQDHGFKEINIEGKILKLELWDTADQEKFQSLPRAYFRDVDCSIMVYDITNKESFESLERWRMELQEKGPGTERVKDREEYPVFVLGNKIDQEIKREVGTKEAMEWAKKHNYHFYEVSAQYNVMIEPVFEEIGKCLDWKSKSKMKGTKLDSEDFEHKKKKSSCC